jgi:hypothetical protein
VLHTFWKGLTYPFNTDGELKWATGILSVDDDFETCKLANTAIFFCMRHAVRDAFWREASGIQQANSKP